MNQLSKFVLGVACSAALVTTPFVVGALAQAAPQTRPGAGGAGSAAANSQGAASPGAAPQSGRPQRPPVTVGSQGALPVHAAFTKEQAETGGTLFLQNCAFCHGKDAGGGESGPDLTRSKLVASDKNGEKIMEVLHGSRVEKGMPRFALPETEMMALVAFIHSQQDAFMSQTGTRKGVEEADLRTGNVAAGKAYFEGAGGCTQCHAATGDLAGVATKFTGLKLEQQMLYPSDVKSKVSVKTPSGQSFDGTVEYQDEFTIGMRDSFGNYHSWPTSAVTYKVTNPAEAHIALFSKYTDDDIHNVLAYVQTMK